jgi:SAM-dependent methyltransferase
MKKYYDKSSEQLVWIDKNASPDYWDRQWDVISSIEKKAKAAQEFVEITEHFCPDHNAKILEGGCGNGGVVLALSRRGYKVCGVDFAPRTVAKLNENFEELNIQLGDVRNLANFQDGQFDAYWSLGVIEHFWAGYDEILREAHRVLAKDGILFLTFPWMSPIRKFKSQIGMFEKQSVNTQSDEPENFYQFSLCSDKVIKDLEEVGFHILFQKPRSAHYGFRAEFMSTPSVNELYRVVSKVKDRLKSNAKKTESASNTSRFKGNRLNPSISAKLYGHGYLIVAKKH